MKTLILLIIGLSMICSCAPSTSRRSQNNTCSIESFDYNGDTLQLESNTLSSVCSQDDNMRGFDPASEDDMDDNGMSRYLENNDKKGWD